MGGQLVYMVLTELPAVYLFYDSALWSCIFLLVIFGVSVWNGGGYYIEVFGRKFERELEALRKELAEATERERSFMEGQKSAGMRLGHVARSDSMVSETGSVISSGSVPTSGRSSPTFGQYGYSDDDSSLDDSPALFSNKSLPNEGGGVPVTMGSVGSESYAGVATTGSGLGLTLEDESKKER
jgi:hypothetical protein